jgi:FtsH-binding integral membrane protein
MLPVWFFIGVILLIYGLIILASGIAEFSHPPSTALANLHPAIWWGMLLVLLGAIYVYLFMPRKSRRQ